MTIIIHSYLHFLGFAALILFLGSCSNDNPVDSDNGEEVIIDGSIEFFKGNPGKNRIQLLWQVSDAGGDKAVIEWNSGTDSKEVPVLGSTDTMSVILTDLREVNQSFDLTVLNDAGEVYAQSRLTTRVYGDSYQQSIEPRAINEASYSHGEARIKWNVAESTSLLTEVRYENTSGETIVVEVPSDSSETLLEDYKSETYFNHRTLYQPVATAIDTFYSESASKFLTAIYTFTNPLLHTRGADPWVTYHDGMYYFTYTQGGGITLYATPRMSELGNTTPEEVWRPPSNSGYHRNLWAPELHRLDGKWYVYFTAGAGQDAQQRMHVIENDSDDPMSRNWVYKGRIAEPVDQWAIDHTVLEHNGERYLIWSGKVNGGFPQEIHIARMTNLWTIEGSRTRISTPNYSWERHGNSINEGPQVLTNPDGEVFVIYSASGFWSDNYSLGMLKLTGNNPLNPDHWTKHDRPVFTRNDQGSAYGPGHNGFFKSPDGTEDWIIYHARSMPGYNAVPNNYRNPRMQPFTWNEDGTPDFGTPVPINEEIRVPSGEY